MEGNPYDTLVEPNCLMLEIFLFFFKSGMFILLLMVSLSFNVANRLESLHECIGITIKDLPLETQHHIEILAKVANILEITDCSSSR